MVFGFRKTVWKIEHFLISTVYEMELSPAVPQLPQPAYAISSNGQNFELLLRYKKIARIV